MPMAAWLVDVGYVVKTAKTSLLKLDYLACEALLKERFDAVHTFLFNGYDTSYGISDGLQKFYDTMKSHGMAICLHPMDREDTPGGHHQRRVDVDLASHIVWQASLPIVDPIVITTGDQDFLPAVRIARHQYAKRVIVFSYDRYVSGELLHEVDQQMLFEQFRERLARP